MGRHRRGRRRREAIIRHREREALMIKQLTEDLASSNSPPHQPVSTTGEKSSPLDSKWRLLPITFVAPAPPAAKQWKLHPITFPPPTPAPLLQRCNDVHSPVLRRPVTDWLIILDTLNASTPPTASPVVTSSEEYDPLTNYEYTPTPQPRASKRPFHPAVVLVKRRRSQ